ncbi:GNAT family N-acetyltransferase [Virgibacillus siamensis]|uniref:GNAT family N-acetyltransferase n=1 Tax=Virgibacillus siamensis TaxID=480071 RepID=UPI00098601D0|nr:GNAT family N-acetyltransferase [Virgibacillus siamensis]
MEQDLQLRPVEKNDLEFLHKLNNNPDVMKFWFEEPYLSMEKLKNMYEKSLDNTEHRQFILSLLDENIGYVGLFSIDDRHRNAEFGIMIDPSHQGNGYAGKATKLALEYGFNQLNLHKIYLYAAKKNEKAIHIYGKIGFQIEGEMKEHFFVNGSYHDAVVMSVFQRDYK